MSSAFDDLARTLARPMPRRHVLRMLGGAVAVAAIPGLRARPAHAATGGLTCPPPTSVCTNGKGSELCQPDGGACCIFSYEIVVCPRGWRCGTEASPACVCDGTVDRTGACVQCPTKCKDGTCCPRSKGRCVNGTCCPAIRTTLAPGTNGKGVACCPPGTIAVPKEAGLCCPKGKPKCCDPKGGGPGSDDDLQLLLKRGQLCVKGKIVRT